MSLLMNKRGIILNALSSIIVIIVIVILCIIFWLSSCSSEANLYRGSAKDEVIKSFKEKYNIKPEIIDIEVGNGGKIFESDPIPICFLKLKYKGMNYSALVDMYSKPAKVYDNYQYNTVLEDFKKELLNLTSKQPVLIDFYFVDGSIDSRTNSYFYEKGLLSEYYNGNINKIMKNAYFKVLYNTDVKIDDIALKRFLGNFDCISQNILFYKTSNIYVMDTNSINEKFTRIEDYLNYIEYIRLNVKINEDLSYSKEVIEKKYITNGIFIVGEPNEIEKYTINQVKPFESQYDNNDEYESLSSYSFRIYNSNNNMVKDNDIYSFLSKDFFSSEVLAKIPNDSWIFIEAKKWNEKKREYDYSIYSICESKSGEYLRFNCTYMKNVDIRFWRHKNESRLLQ